jgi:hypothetical protein
MEAREKIKTMTKGQKQAPNQHATHQKGVYVANVPVKISIGHGDIIIREYEDVIDIEFTDTTPKGKEHIALCLFLTKEKGLSTDEALFTIASEAVKNETKWIVSEYTFPTSHELYLRVKRNGEITFGTYV